MLKLCLTIITVFADLSLLVYGQASVTLSEDTPVRIMIVDSFSARGAQVGQQIEFQVADSVWSGNPVAIPRGAAVVGEIAPMHKALFRRTDQIWVKLLYIRTLSGERIPVHILRRGEAEWKIDLVKKVVPGRLETTVFVSKDMQLAPVAQSIALDHPGATGPVSH
jgi:hypothetical protein